MILSAASARVEAQAWLEDRARREGPGIRLGNLELHPGLGVEAGYDSNVFLSPSGDRFESGILRITPHLDLSTLGPERRATREGDHKAAQERKLAFRFGAAAPFYLYLADELRDRSNVGAQGSFNLTIRPDGDVSFAIYDDYSRRIRPFTEQGAGNYSYHGNDAGVALTVGTRGGVFTTRIGYELGLNLFEDAAFSYLNNFENRGTFRMLWKFFPKTALFFESKVVHQTYFGAFHSDLYRYLVRTADNTRVTTSVGANGALTSKVAILGQVGYAAAIVHDELLSDVETLVAKLYLTLRPRETLRVRIGYDRDVHPAFSGVYYTLDRGLGELETMLGGRTLLGARVWVGKLKSGTILSWDARIVGGELVGTPIDPEGRTSRSDVIVDGSIFGEYRVRDWIAITMSGGLVHDATGFRYNRYFLGVVPPDPASFFKFEAWLGARVFY